MTIVMNMSNYKIEYRAVEKEHADWSPALARLELQPLDLSKRQISMPSDLASINVELFLQRMSDL